MGDIDKIRKLIKNMKWDFDLDALQFAHSIKKTDDDGETFLIVYLDPDDGYKYKMGFAIVDGERKVKLFETLTQRSNWLTSSARRKPPERIGANADPRDKPERSVGASARRYRPLLSDQTQNNQRRMTMNDAVLQNFRAIVEALNSEPANWEWIGPHISQRMFGIT